ncbi:MAG: response regulator [Rhodobiaceae bacterium]|nr:response regulator [Rhodobiaceae bacterium]
MSSTDQLDRSMHLCLIADRSDLSRRDLGRLMVARGYTVVTVATGADLLHEAKLLRPALMLVGTHLTDESGICAISRVRQTRVVGHPAVLYVAQGLASDTAFDAVVAGADDYIAQPFDGDMLDFKLTQLAARGRLMGVSTPETDSAMPKLRLVRRA